MRIVPELLRLVVNAPRLMRCDDISHSLRAAQMTPWHRRLTLFSALLFAPAMAQGQLLVGTGVALADGRDTRWTIGTLDGAFSQGFVLPPRPGTPNLPGSYQWIGATPSGTITRFERMSFTPTGFTLDARGRPWPVGQAVT